MENKQKYSHSLGKLLRQDWLAFRQDWRPRNLILIFFLLISVSLLVGRLSGMVLLLTLMPIMWGVSNLFFADAHSLNILRTMQPLRRVQVVRARYIFVLLAHLAIGIAVGLPLCLSLALWGRDYRGNPMGALCQVILLLLLSEMLEGIRIPLCYKLSYSKMHGFSRLYIIVLPLTLSMVQRFWLDNRAPGGGEGIGMRTPLAYWLDNWNDLWVTDWKNVAPLLLIASAVWLVFMALSYAISVRIYKKSEF